MGLNSDIGWTDHSINFYTHHCTEISPGCANCYMMAFERRSGKNPVGNPQWREAAVKELAKTKPGDVLFINSMSDTFHQNAPAGGLERIMTLAKQYSSRVFLLLTKRPNLAEARLRPWFDDFPANVWVGTSVESPKYLWRLDHLRNIPAQRFISFEPLLGSVKDADLTGIGWVIVGGESGPNRRAFNVEWARELRDKCVAAGIPFFYKQGTAFKSGEDRVLDGRMWDEQPEWVIEAAPQQATLF